MKRTPGGPKRRGPLSLTWLLALAACANTQIDVTPSRPQAAACQPEATALVLWAPRWRADQKDVPQREAAAAQGIERFFAASGCFAQATVRRVDARVLADASLARSDAAAAVPRPRRVIMIAVRELGPVVRLLSSPALVDGGTEVVLDIAFGDAGGPPAHAFSVRWRHGGPGVVKGVASLPDDMRSALRAALQPSE